MPKSVENSLFGRRIEIPGYELHGQGQAASRSKRTRSPPQKKIAARTPTPPVTTGRQTRSSQPAPASKEAARQAVARAKLQYQIKMREKPSQEEGRAQKKPRLILPESSEDEEDDGEEEEGEEEEGHSSARSDSDDSVDDPPYKKDPTERADDDDDDDGDDDDDQPLKELEALSSPTNVLQDILKLVEEGVLAWQASIRDLRFMEPRPELLQAAMVYWDLVMHVFRFRNDKMCPTVEEFQAYLRGFTDCEFLAIPPFEEDMSQLLLTKLNIPEELSTSIIQNGELNIAGVEHFPRQLVEKPMVYLELLIEEWYAFLNDMQSEDIVWRCPWLNLPVMTVNSAGFKRVVLAGLMSFTFYIPGRTLCQLGTSQESRCFGKERFELPTFDDHNLQAYEYSWSNREQEEPLPDPITWLESRYVKWLHREVKARSRGYF
ncbi:hypothetical protein RHMOL_Rhmol10G0201200 [Rhododendron molle]|uniref:Uncharacterized protein n=1 Tax=Rhododendron molle TaxID=49168 RepID=A0ACC0M5F1_RHOML|nr:hypothetical protein RHMOL_Rhmol10G0201200 [Rhododendron molle]